MSIDITPSKRRKPLKINFGDRKIVLTGAIPLEMIAARNSVPRPKVMAGSQKAAYESEVGIAVIAAFAEFVVPEDVKAPSADKEDYVGLDDIPELFEAWSEYVGWGKARSSENSSGATKRRSSTSSDEADSE